LVEEEEEDRGVMVGGAVYPGNELTSPLYASIFFRLGQTLSEKVILIGLLSQTVP
jgi:hypothetical protein